VIFPPPGPIGKAAPDRLCRVAWMPERRIDRVTILGSRPASTTEIPWDSRHLLLERLEAAGGADDVIAAIRGPGTSAPVRLTRQQKRRLPEVVEGWLVEENTTGLPQGIFELRNALTDEQIWGELDDDA
jgi:hypothetical protein